MAILIEGISVIVQKETIEKKFPGGESKYRADCPNATFCADKWLTRIGFMHPDDVANFVDGLNALGFTTLRDSAFSDLAIVDQLTGPTAVCSWLGCARHPAGFAFAWLLREDVGDVVVPAAWQLENSLSARSSFVANEDVSRRLEHIGASGALDVYHDRARGETVYCGRAPGGRTE